MRHAALATGAAVVVGWPWAAPPYFVFLASLIAINAIVANNPSNKMYTLVLNPPGNDPACAALSPLGIESLHIGQADATEHAKSDTQTSQRFMDSLLRWLEAASQGKGDTASSR